MSTLSLGSRRGWISPPARVTVDGARATAALTAVAAGVLHAAEIPVHLEQWFPAGAFFCLVALLQAAMGVAIIWRPSIPMYLGALLVTISVLAVWAVSRTTGLPFGPSAGAPEGIGRADALATALELTTVVTVGAAVLRARAGRVPRPAAAGVIAAVAAAAVAATAFALAPGGRCGHDHSAPAAHGAHADAPAHPHGNGHAGSHGQAHGEVGTGRCG